jgi:hypothetical protein
MLCRIDPALIDATKKAIKKPLNPITMQAFYAKLLLPSREIKS